MSDLDLKLSIDATSLKQAVEALKGMPASVSERIEKVALKRAMQPVYDEATRRVPVGETGNLAKGIVLRIKKLGSMFFGEVVSKAPHSYLVEAGHKLVKKNKFGFRKDIGSVPPHPFLRPAFISQESKILPIAEEEILKAIEKQKKN